MSEARPGIYLRGELDYASINAINFSTLKHMARSPRHYQHVLKNGMVATASMGRGTLAHIAALEPERFAQEYAVYNGGRRAGKNWEAFRASAEADGLKVIKESELDEALAIRDAVRADMTASACLSGGHAEVTLVWRDAETDTLCKGRVDFLRQDNQIADLKIAADIEHGMFSKACARLQHYVQAAMYLDAVETLTKKPASFRIVAVESKAPHDVAVYTLSDEDVLGPGRDAYRTMLRRVAECRETGVWPGYSNGVEMPLVLPPWVLGDSENDLAALGLE